jgi:hypothetical protein
MVRTGPFTRKRTLISQNTARCPRKKRCQKKWADDNDNGFGDDVALDPVDELFMYADMRNSE